MFLSGAALREMESVVDNIILECSDDGATRFKYSDARYENSLITETMLV